MDIFIISLFLGLVVACGMGGYAWASGDANLLWLAGLSGLTTTSTAWLLGSLLFSASDVGRSGTSYDVRETAVLTPQTYIKGQLAVIITSLLLGGVLVYGFGKFSMFLKTLFQVVDRGDESLGLQFFGVVSLLILLGSVTYQQFNHNLIGSQVIRASLRTGGYVMMAVGMGCVLAMLIIMYDGYFLAKMIDNMLLLILCPLFAVIVGMSHAVYWDVLGLHPKKIEKNRIVLTQDSVYVAGQLSFVQHLEAFWQGVGTGFLVSIMLPTIILSMFVPNIESVVGRWIWFSGFSICWLLISLYHYEAFVKNSVEQKYFQVRVIEDENGQPLLQDVDTQQTYLIRERDLDFVSDKAWHNVWVAQPLAKLHVVKVRVAQQPYQTQANQSPPPSSISSQPTRRMTRVTSWFSSGHTAWNEGLRHYTPQQLRIEIKIYQERIQEVNEWFRTKRRTTSPKRIGQRTRYRQQLRNALGRHYEQLGLVVTSPAKSLAHVAEAMRLYEANLAEQCRYIHPYQRLRILYTQQKQYEKAYAVCQAYISLPKHSKRALKSMTYHADKLQKRLKR